MDEHGGTTQDYLPEPRREHGWKTWLRDLPIERVLLSIAGWEIRLVYDATSLLPGDRAPLRVELANSGVPLRRGKEPVTGLVRITGNAWTGSVEWNVLELEDLQRPQFTWSAAIAHPEPFGVMATIHTRRY